MKYYIPISSLNLEAILSSDSISPSNSYKARKFGAKYFDTLTQLSGIDSLILFSVYPKFEIADEERDQFPVVVEIDDEKQLKELNAKKIFSNSDIEILLCNATIYLNPWNCKIYFQDIKSLRFAESEISASRDDKLGDKYVKAINSGGKDLDELVKLIRNFQFEDIPPVDDYPLNVAKGCLWGYVFGAANSLDDMSAKLVSLNNEMRNIASSAISNNGECKPQFYSRLEELDKTYRNVADGEAERKWKSEIMEKAAKYLKIVNYQAVKSFLDATHLVEVSHTIFYKEIGYKCLPILPNSHSTKESWVLYRNQIEHYTKDRVTHKDASITFKFSNIWHYSKGIVALADKPIINSILKLIISEKINKEILRIDRVTAAKIVISTVREVLVDQLGKEVYNSSAERMYINELYKSIVDILKFDITKINNIELISVAAFLLKGEDFNDLHRYLEDNQISDYKYVISLWGALEGYANMSKLVLKDILSAANVCSVNNVLFPNNQINHTYFPELSPIVESGLNRSAVVSDSNSLSGMDFVDRLIKKAQSLKTHRKRLLELYTEFGVTEDLYNAIIDAKMGRAPKAIKDFFTKELQKKKKGTKKASSHNLFHTVEGKEILSQASEHFVSDKNVYQLIESLLPNDLRVKNQVEDDINWFYENYTSGSGRYVKNPKDDLSVITHLKDYLLQKSRNPRFAINYRGVDIDKIIDFLKYRYNT